MKLATSSQLIVFVVLILPAIAFSQAKPCKFPELLPFCVFPKPFMLSKVAGRVSDKDGASIPDSCTTLFDKTKKPVAFATTDKNGLFTLASVPNGGYILVVHYPGFTPALAKIVVNHRHGSSKRVSVHMVLAGIDTCSQMDFKKAGH